MEKEPEPGDQNPFRYCAEYYDKETGSIYLRARYYEPRAEDPVHELTRKLPNGQEVADSLSLNLYTYCHNNPILFFDPSGLDAIYMVDGNGAFNAGHGALAIQDENVKWWLMFFEPVGSNTLAFGIKVPNVGVVFTELTDIEFGSDGKAIVSANYTYKGSKATITDNISNYDQQIYIEGDFTKSWAKASEHEKNPPDYWLNASTCVKYLDTLLVNMANRV